MKLEKVVLIANGVKEKSREIAADIVSYLAAVGSECEVYTTKDATDDIRISPDTDLVISIGGDGTVLSSARLVQDLGIPILAVNLGTFGYITEIGSSEWKNSIDEILSGKEKISRRLMIRVSVIRQGVKVFQASGLNEAVVSSSGISKVIKLDLDVNHTRAGTFRSDGLIIATPTGSTAYSLAAGGPIMDASMSAIVITPICPFTLSNRPLVLGASEVVTVRVDEGQRTSLMLTVDGQLDYDLIEGDEIVIERSRSKALLVESSLRNYTDVIRSKLNWSGEMHA